MKGKQAKSPPEEKVRIPLPIPPELMGLSDEQAEQLRREGKGNQMPPQKEGSVGSILRRNFFTLFNLLNAILAVLLVLVRSYRNMLFMGVVFSNLFIGLVQELRAKHMHDKLLLLSEGKIHTLRNDIQVLLPPGELVLGDVVRLARGDQVPADAQVMWGSCAANESLLTGESVPVSKAKGAELRSGSFLTEGSVWARLTAVGAQSYAGQLQQSARKVKRSRSELMESMNVIIRRVSIAIVPFGLLLFLKQHFFLQMPLHDSVTSMVAAVLGMIPEGLILLTSVALAVGVIRLGKRNALVNELYGIESLARVDVVCMDKTGTLTSGEMYVKQVIPLGNCTHDKICCCMSALLKAQQDENPTQNALRTAFPDTSSVQALRTIPFASHRKWSAACFGEEVLGTLVLGAPDRVLPQASEVLQKAQILAEEGMRVVLLAQTYDDLFEDTLPHHLEPLALLTLQDALRPNVQETIRYFGQQEVQLKVISGDHPLTVQRIAKEAGVPGWEHAVDLSTCEQKTLSYDTLCKSFTIFGRVSPEDKMELLSALKRNGHAVAMIGDGVNDIPALKAADCSIAMAGGSDAASRVAQITLLDGDFASMPHIVLEGRRVINNITRTSSLFLVKTTFSFLLAATLLLLPFGYPFVPIQLTLISSVTVGIPSFVLALQQSKQRIRGQFLRNVMVGALPGGFTVWLLILAICLLHKPLGLPDTAHGTLCTLSAGYTCLWVLLRVCQPFNALRAALFLGMAALFLVAVLAFPTVFFLVAPGVTGTWVLAAVGVLSPLCLHGFTILVKRVGNR